jgi:hypothetical protein
VKVKPKTDFILLVTLAAFAFFVIGLSLFTVFEYFTLSQHKSLVESMTNDMASQAFAESLQEYAASTAELETVKKEASLFKSFDIYSKLIHTANENVLAQISNGLADNMFLDTIGIDGSTITIAGTATEKSVIGNFENNLRDSGYYSDVFVTTGAKQTVIEVEPHGTAIQNFVEGAGGSNVSEVTAEYKGYQFEIVCQVDILKLLNSNLEESALWAENLVNAGGGGN